MEEVGELAFHTDGSYHVNGEYPVNDRTMDDKFGGNKYFLMQSTGLLDKSGKEIYEGDILKWTHPSFKENKIEYKVLEMSDIRKSLMLEPDCRNGWIEIIGNILENKDLLKWKRKPKKKKWPTS